MKIQEVKATEGKKEILGEVFSKPNTQPLHTQGEWKYIRGTKNPYYIEIYSKEELDKIVCSFPIENADEINTANAQRIVKAVNEYEALKKKEAMHDELVEGVRELLNELIYSLSNQCKVLVMTDEQAIETINKKSLVVKYRELLKQAESK